MAATTSTIYEITTSYNTGFGGNTMTRDSSGNLHACISYLTGADKVIAHVDSTDEGASWNTPDAIVADNVTKSAPVIAVDSSDNLHAAWINLDGSYDVMYSKSSDGGSNWAAATILWDGSVLGGHALNPSIAVDSNDDIYVACYRVVAAVYKVVMRIYTGAAWQAEETIMSDTGTQQLPKLYIDSNDDVHCVWYGFIGAGGTNNPRYKKRTSGVGWGAVVNLDTDATARPMSTIDLTVDSSGDIYVGWGAENGAAWFQIQANRYTSSAWQGVETLTTGNQEHDYVAVSKDASNVYVHYHDRTNTEVEYVAWTGAAWGAETNIASTTNPQATIRCSCIDAGHPADQNVPQTGFAMTYGHAPVNDFFVYYGSDGLTWPSTVLDTATLKDYALRLFASRTVANANRLENIDATVLSHIRLFDTNGDYIEIPVARNTSMPPDGGAARDLIFDDTGSTEADPEYTSWTQDYRDLNLLVFVPRFTKTYDISGYSWGYSADPFTVTDYKLYNEGGNIIAEAADTTIGFSVAQGNRYLLRFVIRLFNDVVEQDYLENTRCIVVQEGLSTVARRLLHEGSLQDYSRPPMFMGVGGKGAYYIANGSDGRWTYDGGTSTYTNISTVLFPSGTAEGDAMAFCREGSPPDWIEGIYFDISAGGTLDDDVQLLWEYFDVDDAWVTLKGVVDGTSNFSTDGSVRWAIPTDIQTDAEEKSGTVGSYYRVRLVGGGWASDPQRPTVAAATNVQPLVLQTASSETDLQIPYTRKSADLIVTPFTGTAAKVSASFGLGGIPEEYDSDGYMIANGFEPVREIALFTTPGVEQEEALTLGSYTGAVAGEIATIPDTNPYPLKIITVRNTTTGEIYPVNERVVYSIVEETGGNYLTPVPGVPAVTVEITYIGYTITPTITPQNILSVTGNTQTLFGPVEVIKFGSHLFPGDSDAGGDVVLTPRYIRMNGVAIDAGGSDVFAPNLAENVTVGGRIVNPAKFAQVGEFKGYHKTDGWWLAKYMAKALGGNEHAPNADQYWTGQWPMVMATFDLSDYEDMENTMLHISAMGSSGDQVSIGVFLWVAGNPTSNDVKARVTGWKLLSQSRNVSNNLDLQSLITASLDFRWVEQGDGTKVSPIIDERNRMYLLLAPMKKTLKDGKKRVKMPAYAAWGPVHEPEVSLGQYQRRETRKVLMEELGVIALNYIGITGSAVNKTNETYNFRRGIDWRYVLGDTEGYWVQTTNNPENHTRKLRDGSEYVPNTPTHKVVQEDETYYFGTHPDGADWPDDAGKTGDLYVRSKPVGASGVFVWEDGGEKIVNTVSGTEGSATASITVNKVSWDSDAIWNNRDQDYEWNHKQSGSGGDGAGLINVTFKAIDWSNTKPRKVGVRYLAQEDPELTITYLKESPVMFARAHLSPYSFASVVRPDYGDKLRVFFEIQFGHKRSA